MERNKLLESFDCVILAKGDYPSHPIPLQILQSARLLVCCDKAGMEAVKHGLRPTAIVGDGDSMLADFLREHSIPYHKETEQDYNDLTKATRYAVRLLRPTSSTEGMSGNGQRPERLKFAYVGATGRREDHTLGNISLMTHYHRHLGVNPILITDYGYFVIFEGDTTFETFPGQQISLFATNCKQLTGEGLKWPPYPYAEFWQGTLNEALGSTVTMHSDGTGLAFLTFGKKAPDF